MTLERLQQQSAAAIRMLYRYNSNTLKCHSFRQMLFASIMSNIKQHHAVHGQSLAKCSCTVNTDLTEGLDSSEATWQLKRTSSDAYLIQVEVTKQLDTSLQLVALASQAQGCLGVIQGPPQQVPCIG